MATSGILIGFNLSSLLTSNQIAVTTTGYSSNTLPADWNPSNNTIELIGGGGGAGGAQAYGGSGGAYAKISNYAANPGSTYYCYVGIGGNGGNGTINATSGANSWINFQANAAPTVVANGALAVGGGFGNSSAFGNAGLSSACIGTVAANGGWGNGGGSGAGAAAGGGAGGPFGQGANSGTYGVGSGPGGGGGGGGYNGGNTTATYGGRGGNNHLNVGGGANTSTSNGLPGANGGGGAGGYFANGVGGVGGNGTEWGSYGSGGGGGAGAANFAGGNGGFYGAGGGGAGHNNFFGGNGAPGIVVLTYTPTITSGILFCDSPFSPLSVANLDFWYDWSNNSTLSLTGSQITQINDLSGHGRNATKAAGVDCPTLITGAQNGLGVCDFLFANQQYFNISSYTNSPGNFTDFTVYKVKNDKGGTLGSATSQAMSSDLTNLYWGIYSTYGYGQAGWTPNNSFHLVTTQSSNNNTGGIIRLNTANLSTTWVTASGSSSYNLFGKYGTGFTNCQIGEYLFYNRPLTLIEIQSVENYLKAKWATP